MGSYEAGGGGGCPPVRLCQFYCIFCLLVFSHAPFPPPPRRPWATRLYLPICPVTLKYVTITLLRNFKFQILLGSRAHQIYHISAWWWLLFRRPVLPLAQTRSGGARNSTTKGLSSYRQIETFLEVVGGGEGRGVAARKKIWNGKFPTFWGSTPLLPWVAGNISRQWNGLLVYMAKT
jgi:hypothetical protein